MTERYFGRKIPMPSARVITHQLRDKTPKKIVNTGGVTKKLIDTSPVNAPKISSETVAEGLGAKPAGKIGKGFP